MRQVFKLQTGYFLDNNVEFLSGVQKEQEVTRKIRRPDHQKIMETRTRWVAPLVWEFFKYCSCLALTVGEDHVSSCDMRKRVLQKLKTEIKVRILLHMMKTAILFDESWIGIYLTDAVGSLQDFHARWAVYNGYVSLLEVPMKIYKN